jgi:hypothetical protein
MICANCGNDIPGVAVACPFCGTPSAPNPGGYANLQKGPELLRATARTFLGNLCTGAGFRSDQTTDVGSLDFGAI